jgi:hypothetical protein
MSTKTSKPKARSLNNSASKNGNAGNGASAAAGKVKRSINELWIEKYGVDDSREARSLLRAWNRTFENRKQRID